MTNIHTQMAESDFMFLLRLSEYTVQIKCVRKHCFSRIVKTKRERKTKRESILC